MKTITSTLVKVLISVLEDGDEIERNTTKTNIIIYCKKL